MEIYNSILNLANQIDCAPDDVIIFVCWAFLAWFGCVAIALDFLVDSGMFVYKILKRFVLWVFHKVKKKEP